MDKLGQAGCMDIIIDRINKDLSVRSFGFRGDSKCDAFASGLICERPIGDPKFNGGHSLSELPIADVPLKNESLLRPSDGNPLISDLTVHGELMDNICAALQPSPFQVNQRQMNGALTYHQRTANPAPINYRHDASERASSVIDLEDNPNSNPSTSELPDHQLTSSQLPNVQALVVGDARLIDSTGAEFAMSAVDQDLSSLPLPDFSLFTCDLPMGAAYSKVADDQPCVTVHSSTAEPQSAVERNEELAGNKPVSNGSDDCSS